MVLPLLWHLERLHLASQHLHLHRSPLACLTSARYDVAHRCCRSCSAFQISSLSNIELTQPRPVKPHAGCAPPPRESHPRLSHQIPDLCFARVKALVPPPTVMIPLLTGSLACPSTTLLSHSGHCWVASSRTASRRIIQTQVSLQEYQLGE